MDISRIFAFALLLPSVAFAQGKPSLPGPPSTQPQSVVDATGKVVGEIIAGGVGGASIKYTLSTGDFVVLSASPQGLSNFGVIPLGASPASARVYFREADCSGDAYVTPGPTPTAQFTRHQAMVLQNFFLTPPLPPACPSLPLSSDWLFVSDSLACPYSPLGPGNAITFLAYYGSGPLPGCAPIPAPGLTAPMFSPGPFTIYKRVEDLTTKFTTPFFIQ
jgi:hypothetical protein